MSMSLAKAQLYELMRGDPDFLSISVVHTEKPYLEIRMKTDDPALIVPDIIAGVRVRVEVVTEDE